MAGSTVEREIKIAASPETIFPYLTDPAKMTRWMGSEADLDIRVGGVYRVKISPEIVGAGAFQQVEPNRRVVFTFGWEGSPIGPGTTTVEITLEPSGDHTIVRLVHRDLPGEEAAQEHGTGWDHYLSRLAIAATGGDPGPDKHSAA